MIIETDNVWKKYGRFDALQGLNIAVPEGSAFALIGPNGAGKTTTIQLLMNFIAPSRGTARIMGVDSRSLSLEQLAQIGYVSENQDIPGSMSVAEYIAYLRPFYPAWDKALEAELRGQLRLPPERKIENLSHGMRMKMALACALPFRPKLLILDEPFSGLDPLARDEFIESLLQQAGEMTIFISSHELSEIESFATHVAFLDQGRLLFQEPLEVLQTRLRAVRLVLNHDAAPPPRVPDTWLDLSADGNVLSFVDTQYAEEELNARIAALLPGVQRIEVQSVPLRSVYTTLARVKQGGRNA
jgi:ABC-2 type transport system ATP-binding protein